MNEVKDDIDPHKLHELVVDYLVCSGYQGPCYLNSNPSILPINDICVQKRPNYSVLMPR